MRAASSVSNERTSSAFGEAAIDAGVGDELPEREPSVSPVSAPRTPALAVGCGEGAWAAASRGTGDARLRRWSSRRTFSSSSSFVANFTLYCARATEREREEEGVRERDPTPTH